MTARGAWCIGRTVCVYVIRNIHFNWLRVCETVRARHLLIIFALSYKLYNLRNSVVRAGFMVAGSSVNRKRISLFIVGMVWKYIYCHLLKSEFLSFYLDLDKQTESEGGVNRWTHYFSIILIDDIEFVYVHYARPASHWCNLLNVNIEWSRIEIQVAVQDFRPANIKYYSKRKYRKFDCISI